MRKLLPYLLSTLFCVVKISTVQAQTTEQEPNNSSNQASMLSLNDSAVASIAIPGDIDWWKVQTNADGKLNIAITNASKIGALHLELYDGDALTLLNKGNVGKNTTSTMSTDGLAPGTYFIKLSCAQPEYTASYSISNILEAALGNNDTEPNDSKLMPASINLDDTITGHIGYSYNAKKDDFDWFTFTTPLDGDIYITVKNNSPNKQIRCDFLDSTNDIKAVFINPGEETNYLSLKGLQAGTYFIWVNTDLLPEDTYSTYSFSIHVDTLEHPNDTEPNDLRSQAQSLAVNSTAMGHIEYYYSGKTDSADWYKVVIPTDGMLKLSLSSDSVISIVYFNLYDNDGETVLKSGSANPFPARKKTFFIDGLAAGTYYLKIFGGGRNYYATYTLSNSLFRYDYSSDVKHENNDFPYLAKEIKNNQPVEGHVGFYHNNHRDTSDWWKLNYTDVSGDLKLSLYLLPALIDDSIRGEELQIFGDTLSAPIYRYVLSDLLDTFILTDLKQGVYYIKLNCTNSALDWNAYSLKVSYNGVLPVMFINFSGSIQGKHPLLEWTTANEINCKGFEVQRSSDGISYSTVSFINAKGDSKLNYYSFTDNNMASADKSYYRIKELDNDGKYQYSSTVLLNQDKNSNWYVYSDKNKTEIHLNLNEPANAKFQVVTLNGSIVLTIEKPHLPSGNYIIPVNLANNSSGICMVKMLLNEKTDQRKFYKP